MNALALYITAAAGVGPGATSWDGCTTPSVLSIDAPPVPLKPVLRAHELKMPRVASRFAELAAIGAHLCTRRAARLIDRDARMYLGTGLGDVARTDALYYQVMPPVGEVASPIHFATSGNNMAGFFVAQQAKLTGRNLTLCAGALAFETALSRARSDLIHGACRQVLIGGVDETTVPREFYVRRFALEEDQPIGEGSAWILLDRAPDGAIGELLDVRILSAPGASAHGVALIAGAAALPNASDTTEPIASDGVRQIGTLITHLVGQHARDGATPCLLTGCRIDPDTRARIARACGLPLGADYLPFSGRFPTAAALELSRILSDPAGGERLVIHVNREDAGRYGVIAVRRYDRSLNGGSFSRRGTPPV